MSLTTTKNVRDYAIETPQTIPVFEKLGIDFCCGGNRPLEEACAAANLNVDEVLQSLETAIAQPSRPSDRELRSGSLAERRSPGSWLLLTSAVPGRPWGAAGTPRPGKSCTRHSATSQTMRTCTSSLVEWPGR